MNQAELRRQYEEMLPEAEHFCEALVEQLEALLANHGILPGVPLEHRVKSWVSIAEKIDRKSLAIERVTEIEDIIGIRIIVMFRRDLQRLCDLISDTFVVVEREDTLDRLDETQFGYQSTHYLVNLPPQWLSMPSFKGGDKYQAELQVRTLAQHIWAAASHHLQYKQESSVPPTVRRSIHRVSALLETVDLEFERVLDERNAYLRVSAAQQLDQKLNVDLLRKILDSHLPAENRDEEWEDYGSLLLDLQNQGLTTAQHLVGLIERRLRDAIVADKEHVEKMKSGRVGYGGFRVVERLELGVFLSHIGLVRSMLEAEFGTKSPARSQYRPG